MDAGRARTQGTRQAFLDGVDELPLLGATVEGVIESIEEKQLTQFGADIGEAWPSGDAKMTPVVVLQTELQTDAEDDGRRAVYCRSGLFTALAEALRAAYPPQGQVEDAELIGATMKVQHHKAEPSKRGNDRKLYQMRITPRPAGGVAAKAADWEDVAEKPAGVEEDIQF